MARFLRFAVEESLQGNGGRLKEIVIGAEVFDRGTSYDPRLVPDRPGGSAGCAPSFRLMMERRPRRRVDYRVSERDLSAGISYAISHAPRKLRLRRLQRPRVAPPLRFSHWPNLDPEPDQQYFSDGLTEELIHALTRIPELRVIAWNTAAHFRAEQDIATIRTQLGVAYVLRGAVRRTGQRLRVTAQLVDTASGQYQWSETYNREILDVFANSGTDCDDDR